MAYNATYAPAARLTAAARMAYNNYVKLTPTDSLFPTVMQQTLDFEFERVTDSVADLAEFRGFDSTVGYGRTGHKAKLTGKIPPLGRNYRVTEWEQIQTQIDRNEALSDKLLDLANEAGLAIARRLEIARLEALLTGKVTLQDNDDRVHGSIDFLRHPDLSVTLTAAKKWSAADSTPITDVENWIETVRKIGQTAPTVLFMSKDVMAALRTNAQVRAFAYRGAASTPASVSLEDVRSVFYAETGISVVRDITTDYAMIANHGLGADPWPAGTVVLVPTGTDAFGKTAFAPTAKSLDSKYGLSRNERPGIFAAAYDEDNIAGLFLMGDATAAPLMPGVNQTFTAKVL